MNTFKWLLKREYWEHRGGFFWAPLITGAVFLLLTIMAVIAGESVRRAADDGSTLQMNGVELSKLTETMQPGDIAEMGAWAPCSTNARTAASCSGSRCRCRTSRPCCRRCSAPWSLRR